MTQTAKLIASDGASGDFFGNSVSINGSTMVIGASGDDIGANSGQGSAYVFEKPDGGWVDIIPRRLSSLRVTVLHMTF